jgi:hypothetical protein
MESKLLLPYQFKKIGWYLLIPSAVLGIVLSVTGFEANWLTLKVFALLNDEVLGKTQSFNFVQVNATNTAVGALFIVAAIFVACSKEKNEDEFISKLRLSSLLWAVWVNYILLLLAFLFVYGTPFMNVMIYNMFTVLLIFIIRFNYILYKTSKTVTDEK